MSAVDEQILAELRKLNARTPKLAYSAAEAAEEIGDISESMVRQLVADGRLRKVPNMGKRLVIARDELERFVAEREDGAA